MLSLPCGTFQALPGQALPGRRKAKNNQARNPVVTGSGHSPPLVPTPALYPLPSFLFSPVTLSLLRRKDTASSSCQTPVWLSVNCHQACRHLKLYILFIMDLKMFFTVLY